MNKPVKTILIVLAGLAAVTAAYIAAVVTDAKRVTPRILESIQDSGRIKIKYEDLTGEQVDILLKVEDPNFFRHNGIDLKTPGAGLTTITQGLVKKLYFEDFQPGFLKFKQTAIAGFVLDKKLDKESQIELFINLMYFGRIGDRHAYGMYDASRLHFNKEFKEITKEEYISLVAMIIAPATYNVSLNPLENADRINSIKRLISDEYKPKGLMDLYYGGKNFRKSNNWFGSRIAGLIRGY